MDIRLSFSSSRGILFCPGRPGLRFVKGAVAAGFFFFCGDLYSQSVSASLSGGFFFPQEKFYREIYGSSLPIDLEIRLGISRHFGVAAAAEFLSDAGKAVSLSRGEEEFPVHFRMLSFPLSVFYQYPLHRFIAFLGLGCSFHTYEEKWTNAALSYEGTGTSLTAFTGAECRVSSRIAIRFDLRYESFKAEPASAFFSGVNLGGFRLLGGFSFYLSSSSHQ